MFLSSIADIELYLNQLPVWSRDYNHRIEHVKAVLTSLGEPQNNIPSIHIAGTSGKGSTAYYSSEILSQLGYKVGLVVSPHVITVKERSQINSQPLSDEEYILYFNKFVTIVQNFTLTYTEFLTVFAYWLFAKLKVNYMVIEVGLGGRLDPTNVITRPQTVRAITDIGFDHMDFLGHTLTAIAYEKAGIIHEKDYVLMNEQTPAVMEVIINKASQMHATLFVISKNPNLALNKLPLYQRRNWRLAHQLVNQRLILDQKPCPNVETLKKTLEIKIPGRFDKILINGTTLILDAAHNPQKITALVESLIENLPEKKPIVVVAFGKNKEDSVHESLLLLESIAAQFVTTEFHLDYSVGHDAIPSDKLLKLIHHENIDSINIPQLEKALVESIKMARQQQTYVLITGSFYLLNNVYSLLKLLERTA